MQRWIACLGLLLMLLLNVGDAQAHANIVESDPPANGTVAQAPETARLRFSEPLEPAYSRVVLASASEGALSTAPSRVAPDDPYVLLLDLPSLPEGQYLLQWRTLSQADGHTLQGIIPFAVGDPAVANAPLVLPPPAISSLALPPIAEVALRWLTVLALSVVVGSLIFNWYVWRPSQHSDAIVDRVISGQRWLVVGAAGLAVLATLGVLIIAASTAESSLGTFITSSRVGLMLLVRLLLTLALLALVWRSFESNSAWAGIVGVGALASLSLLSHSAVPQTNGTAAQNALWTGLAIGFDLVHLVATAAWIGALPSLLLVLLLTRGAAPDQRAAQLVHIVARFTAIATAAVITLSATGVAAALQHVGSVAELWTTVYGRALLLKLGLFGLLLLLGGYNRWRLAPYLSANERAPTAPNMLRRSVTAEIAVSAALLLAVGVLTSAAPARGATNPGVDYAEFATAGSVDLGLQVVRSDIGDTFVLDVQGLPPNVQPEVLLRASMPTHDMGETDLALREVEPGRWGARGALLAMPGPWNVEAIVRVAGMNDVRHSFVVDTTPVASDSTSDPALPLWMMLIVGALLFIAAQQLTTRTSLRTNLRWGSMVLVLGAVVAAAVPRIYADSPPAANPLAATPEVRAAGKVVYEQNCAGCHGLSGRGDGPAAKSLPGLPTNFTDPHFDHHTDVEVFQWIQNGKPGTAMPAFGERLGDEQIWQVITYIRQLHEDAQQALR